MDPESDWEIHILVSSRANDIEVETVLGDRIVPLI
jgi:hypothetical protein